MTEQPQYTNRLIHEKSPYLLQHAHNPVDWHPWGDEAFQIAKQRDCPIFLSIGYATCHWCHVMEKESFEDPEVAKHLNEAFVCIKVDREELPEVDSLYMEFAQSMMSGAAGWPLNIILTPERFPIFAATYMPPSSKQGMTGVLELIGKIQRIWGSEERTRILDQSQKIVDAFAQDIHVQGELLISKEALKESLETLYKIADPIYGGMRGSPKFPIPYQANLLLRVSKTLQDSRALFLAERTLDMMHRGGIYDHLGGGFSRYSVDERWQIPHFEKMLYDNALVAKAYLEAWQLTKKPLYQQVCVETLNYMIRDLKHPEGAFYSAEDADSEGKEGHFYTWKKEEIDEVLRDQSATFCQFYGVTEEGNFEGRNLLHSPVRLEEFALKNNLDPLLLAEELNRSKQKLFQKRSLRVRPFRDDKILTSWNGLCITALAEASVAFGVHFYLEAAQKSARFLKSHVWSGSQLSHRWKDGEALFPGTLEDYAFLIQGLLSLYEASAETEWLEWAMQLNRIIEEFFKEENGAYYQTDSREPNLIIRKTHYSDGAEPSGNAVHCDNLLKIYQMTGEEKYREHAEDIIRAVKPFIDNYAPGYCYHLMNINRYYDKHAPTFVIALNETGHYGEEIRRLFYHGFAPHKALVWLKHDDVMIRKLLPEWDGKKTSENKTVVYHCVEGRCLKPMTEISDVIEEFQKL